jgi:hypothetical protein
VVKAPEALVISWRGRQLRVRHDDPHLVPYTSLGATIRNAIELASDVEGLRLLMMTAAGDHYRVEVADDGSVVGAAKSDRAESAETDTRSQAFP